MMNQNRSHIVFWGLIVFIWIGLTGITAAEFYKYTDKDGNIVFVEDKSSIPEESREDINIYKEKYDHLSPEERRRREKIDRQIAAQKEAEINLWIDEQLGVQDNGDSKSPVRQDRGNSLRTKVEIQNNRILVPVIVSYAGREIPVSLLLDTGASIVVLHRDVAEQLELKSIRSGASQTAGGGFIRSDLARLNYLKVGQITMRDPNVLIIDHEGPPVAYKGLLGMNFLRNFDYRIDYANQEIDWQYQP